VWWGHLLLWGSVLLAVSVLVCLLPGWLLTVQDLKVMPFCQAAASALGVLLVWWGVVRYRRLNNTPSTQDAGKRSKWYVAAAVVGLPCAFFYPYKLVDEIVLDEHLFRVAVEKDEKEQSPAALRDYLANSTRQKHRQEARRRLAVYYDRAAEELKKRAEGQGQEVNKEFFNAVLAVLKALKEADGHVVTVGFRGRMDPTPVSPEQKGNEQREYDALLQQHPELRGIAERQADRSAILSVGGTFEQAEVSKREKVILERLSAAVKTVINQDVLTFRAADPGEKPMIEIAYHIQPSGRLYLYVESGPFGLKRFNRTVKGIIRGYEIKWSITVRPPSDSGGEFVWVLDSVGLSKLNYDSQSGDPEWAPYAVVLYSGFYDMAGRLIRNFGLEPGPAPDTFTFKGETKK
jgi:hypothetical protein